jgi:pimeloyl-ACP methyl ester carboxylesterase
MKKKSLVIMLIATFTIALLAKPQFVTKVTAQGYTETEGTLDGANYVVIFPDDWNGMLVVTCRGLSTTTPENPRTHVYNVSQSLWLDEGYAIAGSTYGAEGFCVAEGMNATYQLTTYLIDTYNVTGHIFLMGTSLGGIIMLLLAEKYPDVYSGVLSITGGVDPKMGYEYGEALQGMTTAEIREYVDAPPSVPDSLLTYPKIAFSIINPLMESYFGGTPTEQAEAYEEFSPLHHANISIPIIYLAGEMDYVTPVFTVQQYQDAADAAGSSSYLRVYVVPNGTHGQVGQFDEFISAEIPTRFAELVSWVEIIPESLTFAVMVFLSSISLLVGSRYLRKRSKKRIK